MQRSARHSNWWVRLIPLTAALVCPAWPAPRLQPGVMTSAEICGRCHRDIFDAWKASIHSRSMESRLFQDCLEEAKEKLGEDVQPTCLRCHAPSVAFTRDLVLEKKVSWEGVTCDFCHSVNQVDARKPDQSYQLVVGSTKFGPLKDATPQGHGVAFSKAHTDSLLCAGCHEYRNSNGLLVLSSFSEWQQSSYAADRSSCQGCHMAAVPAARVVDPKVLRVKDATVNLHQMPGGHSIEQLNKAVDVRVANRRQGDQLLVTAIVRNKGAGHMVPTGSPLRKLVVDLEVHTEDGRKLRAERTYERAVVDAKGSLLTKEHAVLVNGARVASDNRLKPKEERVENFTFDVARSLSARIVTRLWYYYSPQAVRETEKKLSFQIMASIAEKESK
ncbi:MAG: hypothetical protein HY238_18490 [Acidobacteria bacterium]|nr:hypothetical protein [Acidobacteriota bacterium]